MATGKRREAWDHTASLIAMLCNLHAPRPRSHREAWQPRDFHPLYEEPQTPQLRIGLKELASAFGIDVKK
jgi:hypothetical protein